ncbi:hypothetical protein GW17_00031322 [Ensete ventricosum]|nr:hypothetical protein GW17_00031322 [Ensete ventricosum]RZR79817.1 hypothetical protein BHM03_00005663 [Ensete ventricosum]
MSPPLATQVVGATDKAREDKSYTVDSHGPILTSVRLRSPHCRLRPDNSDKPPRRPYPLPRGILGAASLVEGAYVARSVRWAGGSWPFLRRGFVVETVDLILKLVRVDLLRPMPIALEKGNGIGESGFVPGIAACCSNYAEAAVEGKVREDSCSSSSIGRNSSDVSSGGGRSDGDEESGETEVQSRLKTPLESLDALEDTLPMRHGISKFYTGKSKSFSSLSDAVALSSAQDLAKHENAYTRKRKNLLAYSIMSDKFRNKKQTILEGVISEKPASSSQSKFISSVISSNSGSNSTGNNQHGRAQHLPPRHPQGNPVLSIPAASPVDSASHKKFSLSKRSFSLTYFQCVAN